MLDVVTLGALLVDFIPYKSDENPNIMIKSAGGAVANVTASLSKLGLQCGFIGKVGDDSFGHFLKSEMERLGVNTEGLMLDESNKTALAFVDYNENSERFFNFYRKGSADLNIRFSEVNTKLINECRVFHFGSLTLAEEPAREATINAVKYARNKGKIISYDPNYRESLWQSKAIAKEMLSLLVPYCDIIKLSEDEFQLMTDTDYLIRGIANLLKAGVKLILISQGANGCVIASKKGIKQLPAYNVDVVDTTGAGDCFFGSFLYKIISGGKAVEEYSIEELSEFADFANASASICAKGYGAIPSMPSLEEVEKHMLETNKKK